SCRARRRSAAIISRLCSRSWAHCCQRRGRFCGVGKTAAVFARAKMPLRSLHRLWGRRFVATLARRTTVALALAITTMLAAIPVAIPQGRTIPVAEAETAILALAIAVGLAHHGGRTFLVLVHSDGEIAQYILVEPLLPLDLVERSRRRLDIEQGKMRLAIFAQT